MKRPEFRSKLALGLALATLAVGCATPAPSVQVFHALGTVRADDRASAERFSALVAGIQPRIAELVPDTTARETEVWVQEKLQHRVGASAPLDVKGFTLISKDKQRGRIHMRRDADYPQWFLAHELVHALLGSSWQTIPAVLEEGLCDVIAAELDPQVAPRIRALRAIEASLFFGRMKVAVRHSGNTPGGRKRETEIWFHFDRGAHSETLESVLEPATLDLDRRPKDMGDALYGIGFLLAQRVLDRHGLDGLHEMCVRALDEQLDAVPTDWLLDAADFNDVSQRASAPRELIGAAEFEPWVELLPNFHADLLIQLFHDEHGHLSPAEFLDNVDPELVLADGTIVPLRDHAHIRDELERRWNDAR